MDLLYTLVILFYLGVAGLLVYLVLVQEPKQGAGDLMGGSADLFSARGVTGGLYRLTVILGWSSRPWPWSSASGPVDKAGPPRYHGRCLGPWRSWERASMALRRSGV